jgi:hypothetical protein
MRRNCLAWAYPPGRRLRLRPSFSKLWHSTRPARISRARKEGFFYSLNGTRNRPMLRRILLCLGVVTVGKADSAHFSGCKNIR